MTKEQELYLNKSYDWAQKVITKQKRFLPLETMWAAYPFKNKGLTKEGLSILLNKMQEVLSNDPIKK